MILYRRARSSRRIRHALIGPVVLKARTDGGGLGLPSLMLENVANQRGTFPLDLHARPARDWAPPVFYILCLLRGGWRKSKPHKVAAGAGSRRAARLRVFRTTAPSRSPARVEEPTAAGAGRRRQCSRRRSAASAA